MVWFWVVVLVVLIGAIAVIAAGRGDSMAEVYEDRPDASVPAGRPLRSQDLRAARINTGVRGYRMDEVDALLARIEADMLERENREFLRPDQSTRDRTGNDGSAQNDAVSVHQAAPEMDAPDRAAPDQAGLDAGMIDQAAPEMDTSDQAAPDLHAPERRPDGSGTGREP